MTRKYILKPTKQCLDCGANLFGKSERCVKHNAIHKMTSYLRENPIERQWTQSKLLNDLWNGVVK